MIGQATIELPGIRGLWSLRNNFEDPFDSLLVLTFVGETRLLAINEEDELEEAELDGFEVDAQVRSCMEAKSVVSVTLKTPHWNDQILLKSSSAGWYYFTPGLSARKTARLAHLTSF